MQKTVKPPGLITILLLCFHVSNAQLKLPVVNGIGNDIKKVIAEYPAQFINLMGEEVTKNPQSTEYECNFKVNGAEESSITKYTDPKKIICSWQALMMSTETFEKAKQKFKSLFNQLHNLEVAAAGNKFRLSGKYEAPAEEKKFASIILIPEHPTEEIKKLKVEIAMLYTEPMEWKVKLLVYGLEREDTEE
jgi:hypothetical protein